MPGALIVLDKVVSTNANFKKTWLLHSQNEPMITDSTINFESTEYGRNGRLQNSVLLPEYSNLQIEKIGGVGKEYWVDGKNWGSVTQEDAGQWRIEVSPKDTALSNNFLNVIQATDAQPSKQVFIVKKSFATKGNFIAISIADRIVAQQLNLDKTDDEIAFSIGEKSKNYKVLITDLKAGEWIATTNFGKQTIRVTEANGTAYFMSKGGSFRLWKMK